MHAGTNHKRNLLIFDLGPERSRDHHHAADDDHGVEQHGVNMHRQSRDDELCQERAGKHHGGTINAPVPLPETPPAIAEKAAKATMMTT
jgi:hypothetical protein